VQFPIGGIAHERMECRSGAKASPFDSKGMTRWNSEADSDSLDKRRM
jgi:hypothetical protein